MIKPFKNLVTAWNKLLGDEQSFSMENRLYNLVCIIIIIILFLLLGNSLLIHLWQSAVIASVMLGFQVVFYYYARFKKRFAKSILLNGAVSYIALALNYFVNSGSYGPTLFLFFLSLQVLLAITPNATHLLWMLLHVLSVSALFIAEAVYPKLVVSNYGNSHNRLDDLLYTYVVSMVFIYVIVRHLRVYFHRQQGRTEAALMNLKAMFESSDSCHVFLDRNMRILYFNRGAADFFDTMYSKKIYTGMEIQYLLNPLHTHHFTGNFKLALQGEKIKEERLLTYHNYEQIWWNICYTPIIDSKNETIGVSFIASNITEIKRQQENIRRKNESLMKIAHLQAHQIRNPVANILGLMNLIKLEKNKNTNEYLPLLEHEVRNLDRTIKKIVEQTNTVKQRVQSSRNK